MRESIPRLYIDTSVLGFKDIVRLGKIRGYNQVNLANGYGILTIISSQGVGYNEED